VQQEYKIWGNLKKILNTANNSSKFHSVSLCQFN